MTGTPAVERRRRGPLLFAVASLLIFAAVVLAVLPGSADGARTGLLRNGGLTPAGIVILAGVAAVVALAAGFVLRSAVSDDGKTRLLEQAPGYQLTYPSGTLLHEELVPSSDNLGADHTYAYGTDASPQEIVAYFDDALGKLGYTPSAPTPDSLFTGHESQMLREYHNGPFTYRLYLLPLPEKVGPTWVFQGYAHILYAKLNN